MSDLDDEVVVNRVRIEYVEMSVDSGGNPEMWTDARNPGLPGGFDFQLARLVGAVLLPGHRAVPHSRHREVPNYRRW